MSDEYEYGIIHHSDTEPHREGMTEAVARAWIETWEEDGGKAGAFRIIRRTIGPWELADESSREVPPMSDDYNPDACILDTGHFVDGDEEGYGIVCTNDRHADRGCPGERDIVRERKPTERFAAPGTEAEAAWLAQRAHDRSSARPAGGTPGAGGSADRGAGTVNPGAPSIESACPNCGAVEARTPYDIGSGRELSCSECEWCWGADGQELQALDIEAIRRTHVALAALRRGETVSLDHRTGQWTTSDESGENAARLAGTEEEFEFYRDPANREPQGPPVQRKSSTGANDG